MLMGSARRIRSEPDLALMLRGQNYVATSVIGESDKRTVEMCIGSLRKRLDDAPASPRWIETVHGLGYRLTAVQP
jgi:DNA-binding response OmpR family regulator